MPARLIGHFCGKARRTLGEGQFEFAVVAGAGRERKGGFWMSGSRSRQSLSTDARALPTHGGDYPVRVLAYNAIWPTVSGSEAIAEHRQSAARFSLGRFVLKDVPVLGGLAVLDADDVSGNPRRGSRRRRSDRGRWRNRPRPRSAGFRSAAPPAPIESGRTSSRGLARHERCAGCSA